MFVHLLLESGKQYSNNYFKNNTTDYNIRLIMERDKEADMSQLEVDRANHDREKSINYKPITIIQSRCYEKPNANTI